MTSARSTQRLGAALVSFIVAGCSGSHGSEALSAQGIVVTISPESVILVAGSQHAFTVSVSGTADQSTTWSVAEGAAGGTITADGLYTAPGVPGSYHVVAASKADPRSTAGATVTVPSPQVVTVAVSPTAVTITAGAAQVFACEVSGSADSSCTWAVQEGAAGGTVTSSGNYTAPQKAGTYHVLATSHADPTQVAAAAVTVTAAAPVPVAVSVSPLAATLTTGASQRFTCTVTGSTNTACTWSVQEGTTGGRVTSGGVYTAPQAAGTYHVVAKSSADATKSATATVTVTAPPPAATVAVSPTAATIVAGASQTFTCTVTGPTDTACTWSVQEGASGGTVTSAGVYTAPQTAGTYHVVARSHADTTKSATAAVTDTAPPEPVAVAVSPVAATIVTGRSQSFTCTVTGSSDTSCAWSVQEASGGTVTGAGVYTAPQAAGTYHVVATSHADPSKSATATVTVNAPPVVSVAVSPTAASVNACQTYTFTASVTGTSNSAVTWTVQEASAGTVTSGGVYSAPATAGTYHVVATSQVDPTKSATATVTVAEKVLSVAVNQQSVSVHPGETVQFTATVTTTCGSFTQTQAVAPTRALAN